VHRWILRLPLIGNIIQSYTMANFSRTLGLLLKGGVRITEAIIITGDTMTNVVYKKELTAIAHGVLKGEKISQYLEKRTHLFPDLLTQMISIGESTGNLSESLTYLAEMYESEVDDLTKNLSSTLEPVLMIFMGILVGFVAVSVITPIYSITQNLHPK
jgi:type IV pilus assembly protein PilC